MNAAAILSWVSGLALVSSDLDAATQLGTSLVMLVCDAGMCRLFAHNNGYPKNLWTIIGFVFGIWAVAALIVMPKREKRAAT